MTPSIAITIIYSGGGPPITRFEVLLISLVVGAALLVGICWDVLDWWIKRTRGRNWPTVSAVIDVVSVTRVESIGLNSMGSHNWPYYRATLTYLYSNPDRQTGDYKRRFGKRKMPRLGRIRTKAKPSWFT
jgi:hypothetical protein